MARRTAPHHKMCRRVGMPLCGSDNCPAIDRSYPPGEMGRNRYRLSDYGLHLREKQKVKYTYGVLEKQLRRYFEDATKTQGNTGTNLIVKLERRLDNVVFRLQYGKTRPQARQFVNHGHIYVNGEKVDIPSALVSPGDVITPADRERSEQLVDENLKPEPDFDQLPSWLALDEDALEGNVLNVPEPQDLPQHIDQLMVVEFLNQ